jgi:hypothetical protein
MKGVYDAVDWTERFKKIYCWKNENIPESKKCGKCANHIEYTTEGVFYKKVVKCLRASTEAGFSILADKNGHCNMFKEEDEL